MSKQIDALKLALEALLWANEEINGWMDDAQGLDPVDHPEIMSAITAIKEALAQQSNEQVEPYCWTWDEWITGGKWRAEYGWKKPERQVTNLQPLFIHPPVPYVVEPRTAQQLKEPAVPQGHKQEPVAWAIGSHIESDYVFAKETPLYTAPPQRKPLTDEMFALLKRYRKETPLGNQPHMIAHLADEVIEKYEAAHGIKE